MKEYFEKQDGSGNGGGKIATEELLSELKGKSLYSEYQVGDIIFVFMKQTLGDIEPPYTEHSINLKLQTIVERDFDRLERDYKFVRMSTIFPVFEKREGEK